MYRAETFETALRAALKAAGVEGRVRAFHDLRHTAITNDAAAGANPVALMTKAGHADMKTTQTYMHMAGVVFRDEADRLEARLLGVESSTHLGESEDTERDLNRVTMRSDAPPTSLAKSSCFSCKTVVTGWGLRSWASSSATLAQGVAVPAKLGRRSRHAIAVFSALVLLVVP